MLCQIVNIFGGPLNMLRQATLRLQEFPQASPSGTPSGGGVYLTVIRA